MDCGSVVEGIRSGANCDADDRAGPAMCYTLGGELEAFITYDTRLAAVARTAGLTVVAPA